MLSQASVLTVSSYPTRTSPVIRGKYVLQNILGTPPPPPPADVPALDESAGGGARSLREQLERHRSNPTCASCHRNMDPLGFGLENYDAIGRWRDDGRQVPGGRERHAARTASASATPGEMRALLVSQLPEFSRSLTEKMMTYALRPGPGAVRPADGRDDPSRRRRPTAIGSRRWFIEIVQSLPFQSRRGEERRDEESR